MYAKHLPVLLGFHAEEGHACEDKRARRPEEYLHALAQHVCLCGRVDEGGGGWRMKSVRGIKFHFAACKRSHYLLSSAVCCLCTGLSL
jgi:hypothetical protein